METKEIIVPKGKSVLSVLKKMEDQTKNAWIFMHKNTMKDLDNEGAYTINYATEKSGVWEMSKQIYADGFSFTCSCEDPEYVFFLKMEE